MANVLFFLMHIIFIYYILYAYTYLLYACNVYKSLNDQHSAWNM